MALSSDKVTVLLADEDALRRDGLAAVLQGNSGYEVISQVPDGETAIAEMRRLRPDIAVIDLNLPKLHGIELVRRVRGEMLGTRIVIMAGTTDDDIVREVVRAGADAYLLKNGPARHLLDAISYVRDGGQYFSPQLRRDGTNRHLLEEPPRVPAASAAPQRRSAETDDGYEQYEQNEANPPRAARGSRYERPQQALARRSRGGESRLRERLREDRGAPDLGERDYEILDMMAEGIRPILDRLDEIDGRIEEMETGAAAVPGNVRGWLSNQIADTFRESGTGRDMVTSRSVSEIEARLPQMIEQAVTARFQNMATKLQQEVEETHLRTLETFVKNIQVKLVQRVSALETDMSKQADAMKQLREYSQRTEDNLSRLISGVDRLAQELPNRLLPAGEKAIEAEPAPIQAAVPVRQAQPEPVRLPKPDVKKTRRGVFSRARILLIWVGIFIVGAGIVALIRYANAVPADQLSPVPSANAKPATGATVAKPPAGADTKTKIKAAEEYADRKDYSMAEDIYKQVLQSEPTNYDVMKALASVLYREDKLEESAAILEKLPKTN